MSDSLISSNTDVPIRIPKRRPKNVMKQVSSTILNLLDADFVFQKTRTALFYGFAPAVIYIGMTTEPSPESIFDLFNILE